MGYCYDLECIEQQSQIGLYEADQDVTRFLWVKDLNGEVQKSNLKIYRFKRIAFGVISSLFLLAAAITHHLKATEEEERRRGRDLQADKIKVLLNDMYVDNFILRATDMEGASQIYTTIKNVFARASTNLRDWHLNSKDFEEILNRGD